MRHLGEASPLKNLRSALKFGECHPRSGDIATEDIDGYVTITGRIKELIITAGGENVPPVLIEDSIKRELPCVSNAMVVGDRKKFLSAILTLKVRGMGQFHK